MTIHSEPQDSHSNTLLDRRSLAQRWSVSEMTIKRRESDGTLKPVYLPGGRLVRYRLTDILKAEGFNP
ncbi:MAG: helix-turn-helix transcriptional regulator [Luteolibacter sp.]